MNKNFLNSIYQNSRTAMQSINDMYPKFRSSSLKQLMKKYDEKYNDFCNLCKDVAQKHKIELKDNNFFQKAMLWTSINLSTLTDKSASHIAELFLLGTVRGTMDLYKSIKKYKDADKDIMELAENLLSFEEQSYEEIKQYLKA